MLRHLNRAQKVALRIVHNRLCDKGRLDLELLAANFELLIEDEYQIDLEVTGYEFGEIDVIREGGKEAIKAAAEAAAEMPEDVELPELSDSSVSRPGDRYTIAGHVIACADGIRQDSYALALAGKKGGLGSDGQFLQR